jgi:hypothetical protein
MSFRAWGRRYSRALGKHHPCTVHSADGGQWVTPDPPGSETTTQIEQLLSQYMITHGGNLSLHDTKRTTTRKLHLIQDWFSHRPSTLWNKEVEADMVKFSQRQGQDHESELMITIALDAFMFFRECVMQCWDTPETLYAKLCMIREWFNDRPNTPNHSMVLCGSIAKYQTLMDAAER